MSGWLTPNFVGFYDHKWGKKSFLPGIKKGVGEWGGGNGKTKKTGWISYRNEGGSTHKQIPNRRVPSQ